MKTFLLRPIDPITLSIFRIVYGICMLWECFYLIRIDFIPHFLIRPEVHFNYDFAEFIAPLPKPFLSIVLIGILISSLLFIIGKYIKQSAWFIFVAFSYLLLLDKSYYNNHLYLICLFAFFFAITSSSQSISIEKMAPKKVPYWQLLLFQLQLGIVYFYGGIAKLNSDWLVRFEPAKTILNQRARNSNFSSILETDFAVYLISYGGLLFDLGIFFLLMYRPTRKIALIGAVIFNGMNAWLFDDINIFPFMMLGALVLFIKPEKIRIFVTKKLPSIKLASPEQPVVPTKNLTFQLLGIYFILQLLLPLRHFLFQGNTEWTGKAQYFSWRMKIQTRETKKMEFSVLNYDKKEIVNVDLRSFGLNDDQIRLLSMHPETGVKLAKEIRRTAELKGMKNIEVKANVIVSFNGKTPQSLYKDVDLSKVEDRIFKPRSYVTRLKE